MYLRRRLVRGPDKFFASLQTFLPPSPDVDRHNMLSQLSQNTFPKISPDTSCLEFPASRTGFSSYDRRNRYLNVGMLRTTNARRGIPSAASPHCKPRRGSGETVVSALAFDRRE